MKGKTATPGRTVWCSAGWNYEYVELPLATAYPGVKAGITFPAAF